MSLPSGEYPTTELSFKLRPAYNPSAQANRKHSSSIVACMSVEVPTDRYSTSPLTCWLLPSNGCLSCCLFHSPHLATGLYATIWLKLKALGQQSMGSFNRIFREIYASVKILSGVFSSQLSSRDHVVESIGMNMRTVLPHCFQLQSVQSNM
jgi:hypothetical protein